MMNYWGGYGYNHMGYWGFGDLLSIVFTILVIVLIVALVKRIVWGSKMHRHGRFWDMHGDGMLGNKTPIDILKERYAKGEIKKEEFEQMKKDLES